MSSLIHRAINDTINFLDRCCRFILYILILFYRYTLSYWLGRNCRYIPSCSEYALQTLRLSTTTISVILITKRVLSCHPFNKQSDTFIYDPPEKSLAKIEKKKSNL